MDERPTASREALPSNSIPRANTTDIIHTAEELRNRNSSSTSCLAALQKATPTSVMNNKSTKMISRW
jgi:hypothetical protein